MDHNFGRCFWRLLSVCLLMLSCEAKKVSKSSVSAVFIFGDSTSDPGNNNYVKTTFKGNFPPYGKDFPNQVPTGRFSNGRLTGDFIARYVGVKEFLPPYLDPTLSIQDLITGVSFASAASGFDPLTPKISNVIPLKEQLEHFKEYQKRVDAAIGKERREDLIENALFIISAGTNDFVISYYMLPVRRKTYTLPHYMDFIMRQYKLFFQGLWDGGARRIGVVGLPPMGCLPIVITLFSDTAIKERNCVEKFSSVARSYNLKLQAELNATQVKLARHGARIAFLDGYTPLAEMTQGHKYNFEETKTGCCGTGMLETSLSCNPQSAVCEDTSKYVFWDSIHPTEKAYSIIFQALQPAIDSITTKPY